LSGHHLWLGTHLRLVGGENVTPCPTGSQTFHSLLHNHQPGLNPYTHCLPTFPAW
jgi:hypothetical protein